MSERIPEMAIRILRRAADNIEERSKSYNSKGINYNDYRLNGVDSCWQDQLECFIRLWTAGDDDKAEDWAAYVALSAAFIQEGVPQSRFSLIYRALLPRIQDAINNPQ